MPELPEVETMVRGLRPALLGRRLRRLEVLDPFLLQGCSAEELARHGRGATVAEVGRRGKWVVVTLAGHRGIIVIQPRMTGGFWLLEPDRPDHIRLVFHVEKPRAMVWYCDTRRLGKIGWYPDADEAAAAFARSHGPDALEIGRDELARAARTDGPRHQAGLDGPESARGDRQYLRRRDPASALADPPRAAAPAALTGRARPAAPGDRRSAGDGDRGWRARASTPAIGPSWAWKGASWPKTPCTAATSHPAGSCSQPIMKTRIAGLIGRPTYFCPRCQTDVGA